MSYASLNGHMFNVLHQDRSVPLRLPTEVRSTFLKKYKTTLRAHDTYIVQSPATLDGRLRR